MYGTAFSLFRIENYNMGTLLVWQKIGLILLQTKNKQTKTNNYSLNSLIYVHHVTNLKIAVAFSHTSVINWILIYWVDVEIANWCRM